MPERPFPDEVIQEFGERNGELVADLVRMTNALMGREPKTIEEQRIHNTFRLLVVLTCTFSTHPLAEVFDEVAGSIMEALQRDALYILVERAKLGSDHARAAVEDIARDPEGAAKAQRLGVALDTP